VPVRFVGKDLEASVATALLHAACAPVMAIANSVYAVAAVRDEDRWWWDVRGLNDEDHPCI
jgi:hypothetical protein